ncbi:MAG TPA: ABC transporter ATP-binding protein [Clostridiales bacterium]|nr:ABC transporter ATP-binding protein [Clostridiales bacterium]
MALLEVKDLYVNYGMIKAIKGVSFSVEQGEIVALIGANGAGKTTIMHAINGLIPAASGSIMFKEHALTKFPPHKIVTLGLTQVPEGRRIFQELTVKDNLILGAYSRKSKKEAKETMELVFEKFPVLGERLTQIAGTLSGGEQQMLAVGRALMSHPDMLLLDEPSMGLSPLYVNKIFDTVKEINAQGTTVFIVEQNAKKALSIADRAYVIETGKITLSGTGAELLTNEDVKKAYLGE